MYLVVASKEDKASMNMRRHLVTFGEWKEDGVYDSHPVLRSRDRAVLVTIAEAHLYHDDIDKRVSKAVGVKPQTVIFLSRHKSESGLRTLTVHAIGCFGTADYGGRDRTLVPSAPGPMTRALRLMHERASAAGLDHKVSFECTHHGPFLETPTFFIEIGSSEDAWTEEAPARLLAGVVYDVVRSGQDANPVVIGVGGGHYAPRFTDVALGRKVSFGHMVPSYALGHASDEVLARAVELTPGASGVYLHRKALKGGQHPRLKDLFTGLGLEPVREKDLEAL